MQATEVMPATQYSNKDTSATQQHTVFIQSSELYYMLSCREHVGIFFLLIYR